MTSSFSSPIFDVVIASGGSSTRAIYSQYEFSDATSVYIQSPATLDSGLFPVQVSQDGTTWSNLSDGTTTIYAPAAGEARQYIEMLGFRYFRIAKATGTVAADRTFQVSKQWTA